MNAYRLTMSNKPTPQREDVPINNYALIMWNDKELLYQLERPIVGQEPEWILKKTFDQDEIPPLNFEQAKRFFEDSDSASAVATVYASSISSSEDVRSSDDENTSSDGRNRNGYWTKIEGTCVPETGAHLQQKVNMVAVVNHLIEQHNLLDHIQLPYTPTWARSNCSINAVAEHPDQREMNGAEELISGDYLCTAHNKRDKKDRIRNLVTQADADNIEFEGEWCE